jgi:tripartite-type tricarboxylate transporter receptor subunit TctC
MREHARRNIVKRRAAIIAILLAAVSPLAGALAQSPSWPARDITIVVPTPPGGSVDLVARSLANYLQSETGQAVVIDNRPGASAMIGAQRVVRAAPDGYTLLFSASASITTDVLMYKKLPYDPLTDFTPIAMVAESPVVVVAGSRLPVRDVAQLTQYAKTIAPRQLTSGTPGIGTKGDLAAKLLQQMTDTRFVEVPYKGSVPLMTDLLSGGISIAVDLLPTYIPYIKDGTVNLLGVASVKRLADFPEAPTLIEQALAGFETSSFFSLNGPAGMEKTVVEKLNRLANAWIETSGAKSLLAANGLGPVGGSPEELRARAIREIDKWRPIVAAAGISFN